MALWDGDDPETAKLAAKVRTPRRGRGAHSRHRPTRCRECMGSAGPELAETAARPAAGRPRLGVERGRLRHPIDRRGARRRFPTNPISSAASATASSTTVRCPTASPWTRPSRSAKWPRVTLISLLNPTTWLRRCRGFTWPTAVLSGGRDLTTPRAVARRIVDPHSRLRARRAAHHRAQRHRHQGSLGAGRSSRPSTRVRCGNSPAARRNSTRFPACSSVRLLKRVITRRGRCRVGATGRGAAGGPAGHDFMKPIAV